MSGIAGSAWGAGGAAPGITAPDVVAVATEVWQAMLGLELTDAVPAAVAAGAAVTTGPDAPSLRATVLISGAFEGGITLELSDRGGRFLAGVMFGLDAHEVTAAETADAIGELANMVGGNLKMLVDKPAKLSLPAVAGPVAGESAAQAAPEAAGPAAVLAPPEFRPVHRVALAFADDVVHIVVHARNAGSPTTSPQPDRSVS